MLPYSNRKLYKGILEQDQSALNYLYKNLFPKIKEMVLYDGGDYDTAKDIFQEAIIIIYRRVKRGKFSEPIQVKGYIYGICKNIWIKVRSEKSVGVLNEESTDDSDEVLLNEYRQSQRLKLFYEHFLRLNQECKQILVAFFKGKSFTQIAHDQNLVSEIFARKKKYLCKEYLVKSIKSDPQFSKLIGEYEKDVLEID